MEIRHLTRARRRTDASGAGKKLDLQVSYKRRCGCVCLSVFVSGCVSVGGSGCVISELSSVSRPSSQYICTNSVRLNTVESLLSCHINKRIKDGIKNNVSNHNTVV